MTSTWHGSGALLQISTVLPIFSVAGCGTGSAATFGKGSVEEAAGKGLTVAGKLLAASLPAEITHIKLMKWYPLSLEALVEGQSLNGSAG